MPTRVNHPNDLREPIQVVGVNTQPPASMVALLLTGSMCMLPYVLPYHQMPVLSFFLEWLAVALGVAAALALLASRQFTAGAVKRLQSSSS